jgi:hypothetical protein
MAPSMLVTVLSFYILGKSGVMDTAVAAAVFSIAGFFIFLNFLWVGKKLMLPLNRIAYGLTAGGGAMLTAARHVHGASRSLAEDAIQHASALEEISSSLEKCRP